MYHHGGNRLAHTHAAAADGHAARGVIDADLGVAGNTNAVAGGEDTAVADLGDKAGLGDHNGDGARNGDIAAGGACRGHQKGLVFAAGKDIDITGCCELCAAADFCGHGLIKYAHVDRCAGRGAAAADRKGCHGDDLLYIALGQHADCAVFRFDNGIVAHPCPGSALADQHADGAGRAFIHDGSGSGSQNIDEIFFTFCLDRHVLCRADNAVASCRGRGLVAGDSGRKGAACRGAFPCRVHGGGDQKQVGKVLCQNADAAGLGDQACAVAHRGIYFISAEDKVQGAADGCRLASRAPAENAGHGDRENIVPGLGNDADIIAGANGGILAHACVDLALVIKTGNVHAHAGCGGGGQRAADDAAVGLAPCLNRGLAAVKVDACAFVNLCPGAVFGKEHGDCPGQRRLFIHAERIGGDGACDRFNIVVYG